MPFVAANNARSTLLGAVGIGDTTLSSQAGDGAKFPVTSAVNNFPIHLFDSSNNREIVLCTDRTGDTFTIVRAQEGTTAIAWPGGTEFFGGHITKAVFDNLPQLDKVQQWLRQQYFGIVTLTDAATVNWDLNLAQVAFLQLTTAIGATRLLNPSNIKNGASYFIVMQQDPTTPGQIFTYPANTFSAEGGITPTFSSTIGAVDILAFVAQNGRLRFATPSLDHQDI